MTDHVLAIDLGKTGCRGSLRLDGQETRSADTPGAPGLANAGGVEAAASAIGTVIDRLAAADLTFSLFVGAAGAAAAPDAAELLARQLTEIPGARAVAVTSDAVTAHAGALGGAPGVVLAAGTGAVATAVDAAGRFTRTDGWGPLLGDEGGGAWIGVEGLRAALRAHDGRGPHTELAAKAAEHYAVRLDELPKHLGQHVNPALLAARFARVVAAAAATDDVAAAIMTAAGRALAGTVLATIDRSGIAPPVPYAITGGLVHLGAALLDPLDAGIGDAVERRTALGGPIDGAALLAVDRSTALEALVVRIT
ncbi:N-acetylglucosamine kinase-like BadF-type ATPase [Nocardia tenerifensis]|uniref:N-acetylglucosamine kinase-like BadF-type ATPase n=1 Tax=Nocardia tenerifensis TaxID=228006 RepID=A0A318K5H1_9NOCA|nr:BadF/BadG/BcrA/BcrD ATPase family protein [Nocardia tenerifensis]PXX64360.1 N-acetylglucosamine kinase-like BadF-type ATPase [Nocardia tenerifensis]